ncbi:MAG: F0F1 ATP synthase subunit B [Candidatus Omnitrophica bacterium]|nr:F0F1 ATP synthase subunit B [Candidatus Omnitrophota bacterium]
MVDISFTIIIQWINFGILLFLMHRFLFKPLLGFLDKRSQTIASHIEVVLDNKEKSLEVLQHYEEKLQGVRSEADSLFAEVRTRAEKERSRILKEAQQESKNIVQAAKDDITREAERAKRELTKSISSLVITCSEKVLEREINEDDHKKFIQHFLKE